MDLKANVKLLNYSRKMLLDDTEGMVPSVSSSSILRE